jgi:hypothetical protein
MTSDLITRLRWLQSAHERQELLGGMQVALFDGGQDASDVIHQRHRKARRRHP